MINKDFDAMQTTSKNLTEEMAGLTDDLPLFLDKAAAAISAKTNETMALVCLAVESKKGEFKQVKDKAADMKKELASFHKTAKGRCENTERSNE